MSFLHRQWQALPPMREPRCNMACGVVISSQIVVAGGRNKRQSGFEYLSTVEIFDWNIKTWREGGVIESYMSSCPDILSEHVAGPSLGSPRHNMASMQYGDTFAFVGGFETGVGGVYHQVHIFEGNSWKKLERSTSPIGDPAIIRVDQKYFLKC